MRKLSEEKRKALARQRFVVRHAADIEGVLFAVAVLRGLRDRMVEFHEAGNANMQAFYLNGVHNAVYALLDKYPHVDERRPCAVCDASGRSPWNGGACQQCGGTGDRPAPAKLPLSPAGGRE